MAADDKREDWEFVSWVREGRDPGVESTGDATSRPANSQLVPEGQRPCPICGRLMHSSRQYGVLIDVCEDHGLWLDKGELAELVSQVKNADIRVHVQRMEQEADKLHHVMELMTRILDTAHP